MTHFAPEPLAEFVRQILPSAQHDAIQQHLLSCSRCAHLANFYRRIISTGSREVIYDPPHGVVRSAKAYFGTQAIAVGRSRLRLELLFDSLAQPAAAGARAAAPAPARQLLYRIGNVYVDMALGAEINSDRATLIGQMLDSSRPGRPPAGVPVVLLSRGRSVARTASNDYGEFQLEFSVLRDLELAVAVNREKPVCLPIATHNETSAVQRHKKRNSNRRPRKS